MLTELLHVQIPVRNVKAAAEWYTTHLGFKTDGTPEGGMAFLNLPNGPFLMLWQSDDAERANFTVNGDTLPVLLYRTERIHVLHDKLKELGVRITMFQDEGFGWVLKFYDPDGNMWGAIQDK